MESPNRPQIEFEGILFCAGTTGVGKTHLALDIFNEKVNAGENGLIIDSQGAENFDDVPHVETIQQIFPALWKKPEDGEENGPGNVVAWIPEDFYLPNGEIDKANTARMQVNSVFKVIRLTRGKAGPLVILIDEYSFWRKLPEVEMVSRCWRHAKVTLLLTTQHLSADLGQVVLGCNPLGAIFKTTSTRSLEFLEKWHGIPPATIREMPEREYLLKRM